LDLWQSGIAGNTGEENAPKTTVRVDLDTYGFTSKNCEERSMNIQSDVYTVDADAIANMSCDISPGVYEKTAYGPNGRLGMRRPGYFR
jgi:hypothetical protein